MPHIVCYKAHKGLISETFQYGYNSCEQARLAFAGSHSHTVKLCEAIIFATKCTFGGDTTESILVVDRDLLPVGDPHFVTFAIFQAACETGMIDPVWLMEKPTVDETPHAVFINGLTKRGDTDIKDKIVGPFETRDLAFIWASRNIGFYRVDKFGYHFNDKNELVFSIFPMVSPN